MKGYSGINSASFLRGYNFETQIFDKRKIPEMNNPEKLFFYIYSLNYSIGNFKILHGVSAGRFAIRRSRNQNRGFPVVMETNLEDILDFTTIYNPIYHGKIARRHVVVEPGVSYIQNIYQVYFALGSVCTLLKKIDNIQDLIKN